MTNLIIKPKKNEKIEIIIDDLAFGGKGVGKINGYTIFVDYAVPLDHLIVKIIKRKKNYAEAIIEKIIKKSPYRVDPKCKYFGLCGGCKLQHINYDKQLYYKQKQVIDCLKHIGGLDDIFVETF